MLRKLIILDSQSRIVPSVSLPTLSAGYNQEQPMQSMQESEMSETANIVLIIQQSHQLFTPPQLSTPSVNAAVQEHGNGKSDATTTASVATPSTGPTKRNTFGLDTFTQHYRIQNQITNHTGWRQSVMPEERGQLALQFFEQYRLSGPEQAEDGATRVSVDRGVSLNLETEIFMAAKDKESYVSIMKQQSMAMTPARQEQLRRCYDNELATDGTEYDDPGAPRATNSPPRPNDKRFDDPAYTSTMAPTGNLLNERKRGSPTEAEAIQRFFTQQDAARKEMYPYPWWCPEPRCGEKFKANADLRYVCSIMLDMSLIIFQQTSAEAPQAVQVRHTKLQAWCTRLYYFQRP
jgi:hypothetical protein